MRTGGAIAAAVTMVALVVGCGGDLGPVAPTSAATTVPGGGTADDPTTLPDTVADDPSSTDTVDSTTSTAATTTTAPAPVSGGVLALDVLAGITVANEHGDGYVRDLFGYPADLDRDGCDTRSEVLQQESLGLTQIDAVTCRVIEGDWYSAYDGLTLLYAADVDIDHVVALKEAWDSGAWQWSGPARIAYANDLTDGRTLLAVSSDSNVAKSDKDPSNWLPSNADDVCRFIGDWVSIKARWHLSMDQSEFGRIRNVLTGPCVGWRIEPAAPAPADLSPATDSTPVTPPSDVYYANCTEARAAGVTPLHVGDPGYRAGLDRDHDGVACE